MDLPALDPYLLVTLPKLIGPDLERLRESIEHDDDARVLAELSFRDLVPAIWLPTPELRAERERARWRLHLVKHRATLKNRVHSSLTRVRASGPDGRPVRSRRPQAARRA